MDASLFSHVVLEEGVDQPVPGGLHLALEVLGGDLYPEVGFSRGASCHCLVVGMLVGVVEDF